MDYYNFLSEVTGFDEDFLKDKSNTLSIKVSQVVELMQAFHKKLNEGIFSSDNGDFCPKCESSKVAHDHEYYYCTNEGCYHVWAKSQERSV